MERRASHGADGSGEVVAIGRAVAVSSSMWIQ